ncbi:MAG: metalloregulator ArsR/SmtB family transcription factor [Natronospirillum sp.]
MTVSNPYEEWALHLKASADPLRLLILRVLWQQSYGVLELSQLLDVQQSRLSHHLKILTQAGLLTARREGNSIFYQRFPANEGWVRSLFQTVDQWPLPVDVEQRQREISEERRHHAEAFFARHVDDFKQQQDLIAEYPQYAHQALALIEQTEFPTAHALEVGPGLGEFLQELSQRFARVDAIDISTELLEAARANTKNPNIRFYLGDLANWFATYRESPQLVVYNMVLHHIPDPAAEFDRVGKVLANGGYLLVTDLCRHEQHWAHTNCGDHWLGFAAEDLIDWAAHAGLTLEQRSVTALRNGFQVQCLLWHKP